MNIIIPAENNQTQTIEIQHSLVIVGANGSGKSHMGAYIEKLNENVLRISAQRALSIPNVLYLSNEESARNKIFYGNEYRKNKSQSQKWSNGETSTLVDDYMSTLSVLFSMESSQLRAHKNEEDINGKYIKKETITEQIKKIWGKIYPHRKIDFDGYNTKAVFNDKNYPIGQMSDGERVTLYLIAQCLITADNSIIVIDEPELHLHASIMSTLWEEIEMVCQNKTFVYITHNLDFAASKKDAVKLWVRGYDGSNNWTLSILDSNNDIPDSLLFELLGARKQLLFVEGQKDSYDITLYRHIYEDYYVVPCHNCQKVIELTKAFNNENLKQLHNYNVKGIVDRDYLSETEIQSYKAKDIYTVEVSEIENLFLVEDLVKMAAAHLGLQENDTFENVKSMLFEIFKGERQNVINGICTKEISHKLKYFPKGSPSNKEEIKSSLNSVVSSIDVETIYNQIEQKIDKIVSDKNYNELIKIFNKKDLRDKVSSKLSITIPFSEFIINLLKTSKKDDIVNALKPYVPDLN